MKFDEAQRWLDRADPQITRDPSITKQIDQLKAKAKEGTLTRNGAAAWYAMVQELRRLADYYERDLIRQLRADGMTWAQVADAVQAQLSSRQAAQAKWKRLIDPGRRTTTGDMQRGGRRKGSATRPGAATAGAGTGGDTSAGTGDGTPGDTGNGSTLG
jgi:hypothetical protein